VCAVVVRDVVQARFLTTLHIPFKPVVGASGDPNIVGIDFRAAAVVDTAITSALSITPTLSARSTDHCPPAEVKLKGFSDAHEVIKLHHFDSGSQSVLYKAFNTFPDGNMHRMVLKVIRSHACIEVVRALAIEKAVLDVFESHALVSTKVVPRRVYPTGMSAECESRSLLTVFAGDLNLSLVTQRRSMTTAEVAAVAATGLQLLSSIHSIGIIHGDIFESNFVLHSDLPIGKSLRLIDFGRAAMFVSPAFRTHVPHTSAMHSKNWDALYLSPFELEGSRISRRDDVFRFAETLVRLAFRDYHEVLVREVNRRAKHHSIGRWEIAAYKRCPLPRFVRIDPVFADFRKYSIGLKFDEKPDYEYWIEKFIQLAGDAINHPLG
jgi:hypothetical protein